MYHFIFHSVASYGIIIWGGSSAMNRIIFYPTEKSNTCGVPSGYLDQLCVDLTHTLHYFPNKARLISCAGSAHAKGQLPLCRMSLRRDLPVLINKLASTKSYNGRRGGG